ncbi:MAG TPA: hypothetical protein VF077_08800 [Nitrospiraceae bacterium]
MRPVLVTVSGATGFSAWVPMNRLQWLTNASVSVVLSSGAVLTYTVQHTFDELVPALNCQVTRSGTTATLKRADHGLSVDDSVIVQGTGSSNLDGTQAVVTVADANTLTYTVANTGATADTGDAKMVGLRVFPHAVLAGLSARANSNYAFPLSACRLAVTAWTSGAASMMILQGN